MQQKQIFSRFGLLFGALIAGVFVVLLTLPLLVSAQTTNSTTLNTNSNTLTQLELLDEQAQDARISQLNEKGLRDLIQQLESEQVTLQTDVLNLQNRQQELTTELAKYQDIKDAQARGDKTIPAIQNLDSEISKTEVDLSEISTDLIKKQSKEDANLFTIKLAKDRLAALSSTVEDNVKTLQNQLVELFSRYSLYFALIVMYIAVLQLMNVVIERFVPSEVAQDIFKFIISLLVIVATVITLLIAFVGNLTYLLTGLGVVSAALVVALQDFVSSMFAFFWIKLRRIYKNHDVIEINTGNTGMVTGVVTTIGIFRTDLRELYGKGELNAERSSGRTVSIPNNVILKAPVINYTQDNRILWHLMTVIVTFESDFELVKAQLEAIVKKQFQYALDHKDLLLDDAFNLEYVYTPKVFMNIAINGAQFDIWFAARYGHYREVNESLSAAILHAFRANGIELAYTTSRIIATPKKEEPPSTGSTVA